MLAGQSAGGVAHGNAAAAPGAPAEAQRRGRRPGDRTGAARGATPATEARPAAGQDAQRGGADAGDARQALGGAWGALRRRLQPSEVEAALEASNAAARTQVRPGQGLRERGGSDPVARVQVHLTLPACSGGAAGLQVCGTPSVCVQMSHGVAGEPTRQHMR
jgi:hypothetical protein